ncbi:aminoglycoside phosphotransferase family protein [Umezawaea sp.]|uniref:aminoglycoside phosphotransferase family protein n=1 Tax=Umezawaea sp. TaxID=1955258 RepID=UPI002ED0C02D
MPPLMHADEVPVDSALVRALVATRFPLWAGLPVTPVASTGTDNAVFRLGDDLVVRLPRVGWAVDAVAREHRWLPRLAPLLPVAIPEPVGLGHAAHGYPWPWSVYRWLPGTNPASRTAGPLVDGIAGFITALRAVDTTGAPANGRGVPLASRDGATRDAIRSLTGLVDTDLVTDAWEAALEAPEWDGPPVWAHGDLSPGNLVASDGVLSAVVDWSGVGVGDPACDLIVAWNLLVGDARAALRTALDVDAAQWARGRGWALSVALLQLPYYRLSNPALAANARHVIAEVTADHTTSGCRR